LMKRWAKLPKVKEKKEKKRKRKELLCVLKILCWWSLKSNEVKYWCLKMENLCALMRYLLSKIIFYALLPLVLAFSFPFFYLTLTLAPLQLKSKTFRFMHCL
jgi:hypothetical protein